jgi:hypothetical protein
MTAARHDDRALVRPFRLGLLGAAIGFVLLGALVAAFGSGAERPEGVAERWLTDIGDTRRDGVKDRALREADEVGPVALAEDLLPTGDTEGRSAFLDLEVGKATRDPDGTRVPYRLHQRIDGSAGPAIDGIVVLVDEDDEHGDDAWRVVALEAPIEGREVPSEGGRPAAEASPWLFVGAIAASVVITAACSIAVRAAGRGEQAEV